MNNKTNKCNIKTKANILASYKQKLSNLSKFIIKN